MTFLCLTPFVVSEGQNLSVAFGDHYRMSGEDCSALTRTVVPEPTSADTMDLLFLKCPDIATASMIALMKDYRLAASNPGLYIRSFRLVQHRRDSLVYAAVRRIASDSSAPADGRERAVLILGQFASGALFQPWEGRIYPKWGVPLPTPSGFPDYNDRCRVVNLRYVSGAEAGFPEMFEEELSRLADSIIREGPEPFLVHAGKCLRDGLEIRRRSKTEVLEDPATRGFNGPSDVTWERRCGGVFLIQNRAFTWVTVSLRDGADHATGELPRLLTLAPRQTPLLSHVEYVWKVAPPPDGRPRPAVVFQEDSLIMAELPDFSPC